MFQEQIRDDIATFTLTVGKDRVARWTVELCGQIAEFTTDEWVEQGDQWALSVLENAAAA